MKVIINSDGDYQWMFHRSTFTCAFSEVQVRITRGDLTGEVEAGDIGAKVDLGDV